MYNETFRRLLETYDLWFVGKSNEDDSQLEFTFNLRLINLICSCYGG